MIELSRQRFVRLVPVVKVGFRRDIRSRVELSHQRLSPESCLLLSECLVDFDDGCVFVSCFRTSQTFIFFTLCIDNDSSSHPDCKPIVYLSCGADSDHGCYHNRFDQYDRTR